MAGKKNRSNAPQMIERLEQRELFSAAPGGLTATFFSDNNLTTEVASKTIPTTFASYGRKAPIKAIQSAAYSVEFTGTIKAPFAGSIYFATVATDGVKLAIDNNVLVNDWDAHDKTVHITHLDMVAGQTYNLQLDYQHSKGPGVVAMLWGRSAKKFGLIAPKFFSPIVQADQSTPSVGATSPNATPVVSDPAPVPVVSEPAPTTPTTPITPTDPTTPSVPTTPPSSNTGDTTVPVTPPPATTPPVVTTPAPSTLPVVSGRTLTVNPAGLIKTISMAANLAKPGDLIVIKPGTYHESINLTVSGTADKPIIFAAEQAGSVIIDGSGFKTVIGSNFGKTAYVQLMNLTIQNCTNPLSTDIGAVSTGSNWTMTDVTVDAADGTGIDVWGSDITLTRVTVKNCGRAGLSGGGCSNVLVKDCVTTGNNTKGNDPSDNAGAGKWNKCDHITVDGLDSYNNTGTGLWFDYNNSTIVIRNCKIHDNHGLNHDYEGVGLSIELCTGPLLVENNQFYNNTGANIGIRSSRHITIQNNSMQGSYLDMQDWPRGADYTDLDFTISGNTFDGTKIFASGGTWDATSAAGKQITYSGNTYKNSPAALFTWGGVDYTLDQAKATLGLEKQ